MYDSFFLSFLLPPFHFLFFVFDPFYPPTDLKERKNTKKSEDGRGNDRKRISFVVGRATG